MRLDGDYLAATKKLPLKLTCLAVPNSTKLGIRWSRILFLTKNRILDKGILCKIQGADLIVTA